MAKRGASGACNPNCCFPVSVLCVTMAVTATLVKETLLKGLDAEEVVVEDTSGGCGSAFEVYIVSAAFEGKALLARHRLVNTAMGDLMPQIHALSIKKAITPTQKLQQAAAT